MDYLDEVSQRLNKVSPSFCVAKWRQVSFHLESGTTHSCHHPEPHVIPLSELEKDPSALHNTQFKLEQQNLMLQGKRPKECGYCWGVEDLKSNFHSDRILKSSEPWALPLLNSTAQLAPSTKTNPSYVEVSFSRTCNLKCSYCSANFSTKWAQEIEQFGTYPLGHAKPNQKFYEEDSNPYIKAFWSWWPTLKKDLKVFRITGGEPLLSPNTFRVLNTVIEEGAKELSIGINSNLMVPESVMNRFLELVPKVSRQVKEIMLYSSIDGWGAQAEYIRHGLKVNEMWRNVHAYLSSSPETRITFMVTFNALSLFSFKEFLSEILILKKKYETGDEFAPARIQIDISHLTAPFFLSLKVLPPEYNAWAESALQFMIQNAVDAVKNPFGFYPHEIHKLDRSVKWMKSSFSDAIRKNQRADFHVFFSEHDRRRKTNFRDTFPELKNFFNESPGIWKMTLAHFVKTRALIIYHKFWNWRNRHFRPTYS